MPRRDGTGPTGQGSMTGRGAGNCNVNAQNNSGMGRGRRLNQNFQASNTQALKNEDESLRNRLSEIEKKK